MAEKRLNLGLQENLLALIAHNDEHGRIVARTIDVKLFEGDYREIAERCIEYWRQYDEAPKLHTTDLFSETLSDPHNRRGNTYRRVLGAMVDLAEGMNTTYVMEQLRNFTRLQRMKSAILQAAERLNAQAELAIGEVEELLNSLLRARDIDLEPGMRLRELARLLDFLEQHYDEFRTGIVELDRRNVVPFRQAVFLLMAATGIGKTWGLIHLGKHALMQRKKVLHLSGEMGEEEVSQRYLQSLFSVSKREEQLRNSVLELDEHGHLEKVISRRVEADFTFESDMIKEELEARLNIQGSLKTKFDNLIVKRFPTGLWTMNNLVGFMDFLEIREKFVPDMVILDYAALMKIDPKNHWLDLGNLFAEFRGVMVERNMAGVTANQLTRAGGDARTPKLTHAAQAKLADHADIAVMLARTDAEAQRNLARLLVGKARGEKDKFGVLITQNYAIGQFAIDSTMLSPDYFKIVDVRDMDEQAMDDDESGD